MIKANGNKYKDVTEKKKMINNMITKFEEILNIMDLDLSDQQIKDTPERIAKSWINDYFCGCYNEEPKITVFDNENKIDSMVFVGPIDIKSTCSHHFAPFSGRCFVSYVPNDDIIGISKFSRIIKFFMRRPQIQEELTQQIADYIQEKLKPKGVAVYMSASHSCMRARGVEESNSWMDTSDTRGCFRDEPETRKEFFDMINMRRGG